MRKDSDKIKKMFDAIAPKYDFLNHLLSMGVDKGWRRRVVRQVVSENPTKVLDMATGTADLAIAMSRRMVDCSITGGDLSPMMLEVGRTKVAAAGLSERITLRECTALDLPFDSESFDTVTAAFGVRNFEDLLVGLTEMCRVTRRGGRVYVLEFSRPSKGLISALYMFYFRRILPSIGRLVSKDDNAYSYLPDSVLTFPCGEDFTAILTRAGYERCTARRLTFGIATIYRGEKP